MTAFAFHMMYPWQTLLPSLSSPPQAPLLYPKFSLYISPISPSPLYITTLAQIGQISTWIYIHTKFQDRSSGLIKKKKKLCWICHHAGLDLQLFLKISLSRSFPPKHWEPHLSLPNTFPFSEWTNQTLSGYCLSTPPKDLNKCVSQVLLLCMAFQTCCMLPSRAYG